MKHLNEAMNESLYENRGRSLNGLSSTAKSYARRMINVLTTIDGKYNDWSKVSVELAKPGKEQLVLVYYDNHYIDAFEPGLYPDDINIVDELGWRHV